MKALITRLARQERGFTLIELLMSMIIGIAVLGAALTLLEVGANSSTRTTDRVDATQRGRNVMIQVQRRLRSQVCLDDATPPISFGDGNTIKYYTDTDSAPDFRPQWHWLWYDGTYKGGRGAIRESVYTADQAASQGPPFTFTGTPRDRVLVEDVALNGSTPFLSYYAFDNTGTPTDESASPLATPLSTDITSDVLPANSMAKVVRVDVSFRVLPGRTSSATGAPTGNQNDAARDAVFTTSAYARNTDYTDTTAANRVWGPRCS
jgi:type II secretory pathway pseudopilin PulG